MREPGTRGLGEGMLQYPSTISTKARIKFHFEKVNRFAGIKHEVDEENEDDALDHDESLYGFHRSIRLTGFVKLKLIFWFGV